MLKAKLRELDKDIERLEKTLEDKKRKKTVLLEALEIVQEDSYTPQAAPQKKGIQRTPKPVTAPARQTRKVSTKKAASSLKTGNPVKCGKGKKAVKSGVNMDLVVKALTRRSPHWMRPGGIVLAIKTLKLCNPKDIPDGMNQIVSAEMAKLRKGAYNVPGLEYRSIGKQYEYRIVSPEEAK